MKRIHLCARSFLRQDKKTGSGPTKLLSDLRGSGAVRSICMPHPYVITEDTPTQLIIGTSSCELWHVTQVKETAYDLKVRQNRQCGCWR